MSDPPAFCYNPSMLKEKFVDVLLQHKTELGATEEDMEKMLWKNMFRVLEQGWK